ncbi:MAG: SAM-dependent DNA methyltransferase [Lachnospiraceae bacterium]|nr:SAM-dependent DNA methyltransferase [Lachnospiraceae bacterium]
MQLNEDAIKELITAIGYTPQDGKNGIYFKSYPNHGGYCVFLDFNNQKIIYDSDENPSGIAIKVWERTTSNFSQAENFVVLECVDSLLEKGYAPFCIELEKTYPSGHGRSGRLDVLVKSAEGAPFLMIECKTWGTEFDKEQSKMLKNGGQLFTYYANDRAAKFLCLYTSQINSARERKNIIVDVDPAWTSLSGVKEIYGHWNKNFKDNGIFDSYAVPYDVKHRALTYGKLEMLKEEHSGKIYNQIMEILRHNAISDKPNAFNKLLNLFVCKIIDEADKNPEDELEFQWLESDTDESLQLRLNDLYKRGMWRFLEIDVIDYEQCEVSEKLANIEDSITKQWIMKMYTDTRLKKSPNFAFLEVQDDRTFDLNAKVVREIVELLQAYKFRYEQKHEFLGNFFELLLNTSMKQEAGQFFTPVPITRFIICSLPLAELVQKRVNDRQGEPLPAVIDYACGSGHFLTEYMSQMQEIIDTNKIDISRTSPRIKNLIRSWQGFTKFLWAKDCVYGIDLDNRLVKTTKVSAFFNGDGEANIVWANGLDSFTKSEVFRGKLIGGVGQDNGKFDILISNPPYSVDAFKSTIKYGEESFDLYSSLTDNSSEIECLFIERMKQLLKVGGWAAVILPSSILTNSGIYAKARAILLKYFTVKAIVEAGSNTFMKTNTSTVILFLERRNNDDHINISRAIDRFFASYDDVTVSGIENAFSTYVSNVYDRLTFKDYISLFNGTPSEASKAHELYEDYIKAFGENFRSKAVEVEKEKLLYFLLTYNQTIVLVKTGKGREEKKFLGYEFSERRGHEGLHHLAGGTKLYDETDPLNPGKVSGYIYRAFLGERIKIAPELTENMHYGQLCQFIEYGTGQFSKAINLGKPPGIFFDIHL